MNPETVRVKLMTDVVQYEAVLATIQEFVATAPDNEPDPVKPGVPYAGSKAIIRTLAFEFRDRK